MFNRGELKSTAKKTLTKNYWWIVLVTLIVGVLSGSGASIIYNFSDTSLLGELQDSFSSLDDDVIIDENGDIVYDDGYGYDDDSFGEIIDDMEDSVRMLFGESSNVLMILVIIFLLILVVSILLGCFVFNPLIVGCRRWYIKDRKEKAKMNEIIYPFKRGYMNTVKVMFCKDLFVSLWSLLLIFPGIIKQYEYRMVPYLLAENPEMSRKEAFSRSRNMMMGNKWDAFVLDLSFIGWDLLSSLTFGILGLLYVEPYVQLTHTELYVCLCQGRDRYVQENSIYRNPYGGGFGGGIHTIIKDFKNITEYVVVLRDEQSNGIFRFAFK